VAFGHDFKSGQSTEAKQIRASWEGHVNSGITFGAFIAMLVIRACPSIFLLPLPAIKAGGRIREIVSKLSMRLVERGAFQDRGRDILSILMKAERERSSKEEGLTPQQIVDNVRFYDLFLIIHALMIRSGVGICALTPWFGNICRLVPS